jgi:hypothetical protein
MRSRHPSHLVLASAALLFVAGCSKSADSASSAADSSSEAAGAASDAAPAAASRVAADAASSRDGEAPDIGQDVAPGVAFSYRYAFTLPAKAIAGVQQEHAAACERLGPTRCQVTGMSYDQPKKGEVSARLDLMLAPEITHGFGSDALASVEKADGSVDNASLNGDNAGGAIEESQRHSMALKAQLGRIEKRLTMPGIGKEEKTQLAQRADELRQQLGSEQQTRQDKEASLAMTPMSFTYASEGVFGSSDPFGKAASASFGSMSAMLSFLLTAAGLLLPWLLLGALVVLLIRFRTMKQRLARATGSAVDSAPPSNRVQDC